jgi:rubredoxin
MTVSERVKCGSCGWVHVRIGEDEARASAAPFESYLRCARCGASSSEFVTAQEGDAPLLATLPGIVIEINRG